MSELEFNEPAFDNAGKTDLGEISEFIKNLKLKSVPIGGIDKASAIDALRELYRMFTKVHEDTTSQLAMERKTQQTLRRNEKDLEQQISALKAENEAMAQTVKQQLENSNKAAELENDFRRRESGMQNELDALRQKLKELEDESADLRRKHQRELELAKAGAAEKGETLEEIYLDARRSRSEMLEQAQKTAEEILEKANQGADEQRRLAEQDVADKKQLAGEIVQQANENAAQILKQAELEHEESRQRCEESERLAQKVVNDAEAEAERIIESARTAYQQERKKYDELLVRLGSLRAKTVQSISDDVAKLNELVFNMSGRGIETDALNSVELSSIDDVSELDGECDA